MNFSLVNQLMPLKGLATLKRVAPSDVIVKHFRCFPLELFPSFFSVSQWDVSKMFQVTSNGTHMFQCNQALTEKESKILIFANINKESSAMASIGFPKIKRKKPNSFSHFIEFRAIGSAKTNHLENCKRSWHQVVLRLKAHP